MSRLLVLAYFLYFAFLACSPLPPKRDFDIELWGAFSDSQTIERKTDEGHYMSIPTNHPAFDNFICLTPEDYAKEREYQELLKKSCQAWR